MTKLATEDRKELSKKDYALPEERRFPIEDKAHARSEGPRRSILEGRQLVECGQGEGRCQG